MRAAVLNELSKPLDIEDIEIEGPRAGEIAIRVVASGICHSDLSTATGVLRSPLPVVLGHEAGGIVEAVGEGVDHLAVGDPVIATLTPACGTCPACSTGKPYLCFQMTHTVGRSTQLDGTTRLRRGDEAIHQVCGIASFAERAVFPAGAAVVVPGDVPLETVCLIGCGVTTGVGAVFNTAQVPEGASVAVLGCGGVGLSIVQACRIRRAATIIAVDPMAEKRDLALELGATHALDPTTDELKKQVRKIARFGVDFAFEAIGLTETIEQLWDLLGPNGLATVVGMPSARESVTLRVGGFFQQKRIGGSVYGSCDPARDIPRFIELYQSGELRLEEMITSRIGLEGVNDALDDMRRGIGARSVIVF